MSSIPGEKDLVWLPIELAKKVKGMNDAITIQQEINTYIEQFKQGLRQEIKGLDDDILQFKAGMVNAKISFKQVQEEELEALITIWEQAEPEISKLKSQIKQVYSELDGVLKEINRLDSALNSLNIYKLDHLTEVLNKFQKFREDKELFDFVMKYMERK